METARSGRKVKLPRPDHKMEGDRWVTLPAFIILFVNVSIGR